MSPVDSETISNVQGCKKLLFEHKYNPTMDFEGPKTLLKLIEIVNSFKNVDIFVQNKQ